jgi:hypothetical protein
VRGVRGVREKREYSILGQCTENVSLSRVYMGVDVLGIGRSGTFCCIHAIVTMMNNFVKKHRRLPPINVVRTVLKMREYRPKMVQSKVSITIGHTTL